MRKRCSKCLKTKDLEKFNISRSSGMKFDRTPWCKLCAKAYTKAYTAAHKEERKAYNNHYKQINKEKLSIYNREYLRKYYKENKARLVETQRVYNLAKRRTDPSFRLLMNIRRRMHHALMGRSKSAKTLELLQCSIEDLKLHLSKKFQPGMNWANYSLKGWHLDHVIPFASFNLLDPAQLKKACCYKNLQPLWASDNFKKGKRL